MLEIIIRRGEGGILCYCIYPSSRRRRRRKEIEWRKSSSSWIVWISTVYSLEKINICSNVCNVASKVVSGGIRDRSRYLEKRVKKTHIVSSTIIIDNSILSVQLQRERTNSWLNKIYFYVMTHFCEIIRNFSDFPLGITLVDIISITMVDIVYL